MPHLLSASFLPKYILDKRPKLLKYAYRKMDQLLLTLLGLYRSMPRVQACTAQVCLTVTDADLKLLIETAGLAHVLKARELRSYILLQSHSLL
jgi:hypothetical protein